MSGLELKNICKSYHDADRELTVIDKLNYSLPESGSIAIVGKSGVGKSTLLHMIGGLDFPTGGEVIINGVKLNELSQDELSDFRGKNIGFIFQFHHLLAEFDAVENVAMPLIIGGESDALALSKARNILNRVGLESRLTHRPSMLSGGEQQRVAIARAVVGKPRLVLADEPTGNLDHQTALQVQGLLRDIQRELNNLMVIVTHNSDLANSMDIMLELLPGGNLVKK